MIWSHYSIDDLHQSSSFRFVDSFAMGRSLRIAFWLPCAALLLPSDLPWAWADAGPRRRVLAATSASNLDGNGLKGKSTGNHGFSHEMWGFPVNFSFNQSIEHRTCSMLLHFCDATFVSCEASQES